MGRSMGRRSRNNSTARHGAPPTACRHADTRPGNLGFYVPPPLRLDDLTVTCRSAGILDRLGRYGVTANLGVAWVAGKSMGTIRRHEISP